jgi:uncharacterized protein (UPF0333 family)
MVQLPDIQYVELSLLLLLLLLTAIGFPPGGSVQYTSTKTQTLHNKNKTKQNIQYNNKEQKK